MLFQLRIYQTPLPANVLCAGCSCTATARAAAGYIFKQAAALQAHVQKILSNQILNRKLLVWLHIRKLFLSLLLQIGLLGLHYFNSVSESPVLILGYKYQMMIYYLAVSILQWQVDFNLFNLRWTANSFESWEVLWFFVQIMAKPWACAMWIFTPHSSADFNLLSSDSTGFSLPKLIFMN